MLEQQALTCVASVHSPFPSFDQNILLCREVQQQATALQAAQAELWAERSQLTLERQATAEDRARAAQQAQEAASAHSKLLAQVKHVRQQSSLVSVAVPYQLQDDISSSG